MECLSTLYIDKPMKAHTLMQAIARANRVYPGKDFGLIVDYNGMLRSLREALAQYALGDDGDDGGEIVEPVEERVQALIEAIEATEAHLACGSASILDDVDRRNRIRPHQGSEGRGRGRLFQRWGETPVRDALAREVFRRFKALLTEPSVLRLCRAARQHRGDLQEADGAARHRRCDGAAQGAAPDRQRSDPHAGRRATTKPKGLRFDLSQIDMEKLRDEFAKKVRHKATALQDIREIIEQKLAEMLARNPSRMDYQQKYEEIVADYNREKDRATIEETFRRLTELMDELDAEQQRAVEEGLSEDELALFDLLKKEDLGKAERERIKQASRDLLASIKERLADLNRFWEKEQTKAEVRIFILNNVYANLPSPPFTDEQKEAVAGEVYAHIWQQAVSGEFAKAA